MLLAVLLDREIRGRLLGQKAGAVEMIGEFGRHLRVPEIGPQSQVVVPVTLEMGVLDTVGEEDRILHAVESAAGVQEAWIEEQTPQCGFCQKGQIIAAKVLLDKNPNPTDAQIREGMASTLCRCMTYYRVQAAIKRAATTIASRA